MEAYQQLDYDEMRAKLIDLAEQFPNVLSLNNSDSQTGVPYLVDCDEENEIKCVLDIVTITDSNISSDEKVQVFFAGSLKGDERLSS